MGSWLSRSMDETYVGESLHASTAAHANSMRPDSSNQTRGKCPSLALAGAVGGAVPPPGPKSRSWQV